MENVNELKEKYENQTPDEANLVRALEIVRKEIKEMKNTIPWPPQPDDLVPEKVVIPPLLNLSLSTFLNGNDDCQNQKTERLKMSFAQDLIYAVTQGKATHFFKTRFYEIPISINPS